LLYYLNELDQNRNWRRYEDNIKMDLREIVWERADWIHLAQDRDEWWVLVDTVRKLRVHERRGILH